MLANVLQASWSFKFDLSLVLHTYYLGLYCCRLPAFKYFLTCAVSASILSGLESPCLIISAESC